MARFLMVALLLACAFAAPSAHAQIALLRDEPSRIEFGAGSFNINSNGGGGPVAAGEITFRYGRKFLFLGPAVGILVNGDGGALGYAGIYGDLRVARLVFTPLAAIAGYERGGGEDLGGPFAFRLAFAGAYEFANSARIGLQIAHVSNDRVLRNRNPGENEVMVTYAIPLRLPL